MKRMLLSLSVTVMVLATLTPHASLSQIRRPRQTVRPSRVRPPQAYRQPRSTRSGLARPDFGKTCREYEDEAALEALGVDADQWKRIKPKMERIKELGPLPTLVFGIYAFAEGGDSGSTHSSRSRTLPTNRGGTYGFGGGSAGGGGGGSARSVGGSVRYGVGGGAHGAGPSGGYGYTSGSSYGSSYSYSVGGGAGPNGDRPVMKQVGELSLGWLWRRPSEARPDRLTEGDHTCERLLDAIETEPADRDLVQQHIEELRQLRKARQRELEQTQQQLRELVTPEQEAKLILMGYLD